MSLQGTLVEQVAGATTEENGGGDRDGDGDDNIDGNGNLGSNWDRSVPRIDAESAVAPKGGGGHGGALDGREAT